jgi:hypothetical protein
LVLGEFAVFVMVFLRLHKLLVYLEPTAASRCEVEGGRPIFRREKFSMKTQRGNKWKHTRRVQI